MNALVGLFIRNSVAANMLMLLILAAGAVALMDVRIEGFPRLPPDTVEITVVQVGASAQQIEESVTRSLEEALEGLPGAKTVSSISAQGYATVYVQRQDHYELERLIEDVKLRIDNITTLPSLAERPQVRRAEFNYPALIVQVYGNVGPHELQKSATMLKQRLLARPEIAQLNQWGLKQREIIIEIPPETLKSYQLTLDDIAQLVQQSSLEYRTGELKGQAGRVQVRSDNLARDVRQLEAIPVFRGAQVGVVTLADIATIRDGFEDQEVLVEFQGQQAIGFEAVIGSDGNLLALSQAVDDVIAQSSDILNGHVQATVWANQSGFAQERISMLSTNAWQGLILVFLVLALFLNAKLAFWVALGIPVALAGTVAVMSSSVFNYSLNDITTFGMILVLGILVDDAVVGESVFDARGRLPDPIKGTEQGVHQVMMPTLFGVLTTIAAFYPMTVFTDPLGQAFGSFAVVVIVALVFSLIESKFILPSHLAQSSIGDGSQSRFGLVRRFAALQRALNNGLQGFIGRCYRPVLEFCLAHRWQTIAVFFIVGYLVSSLVSLGLIRATFFPDIPGNIITVTMETDGRIHHDQTVANARAIVAAAEQLNQRWGEEFSLDRPPIEKLMVAVVGASSTEIYAELTPPNSRPLATLEIVDQWRQATGELEGAVKLEFSGVIDAVGGFELDLFGPGGEELLPAATAVIDQLNAIPGVVSAWSNVQSGKPELRLTLNENGIALGLDTQMLTRQVSNAYGGVEIQRFQRGSDEVKTYARFPEQNRNTLNDLYELEILLPNDSWVPLLSVATVESHYVPHWSWRKDFQAGASIQASIDKSVTSAPKVYQALMSNLEEWSKSHSHIVLEPAGELQQEDEISDSLWKALIISCLLIYILMAIPLKSYWQPLIIMSVVPFGFVGAALGHALIGIPLSLLSFFGMLALAGIVVNDSLVLISRINLEKRAGNEAAVMSAACSRFRPILLTTITTVVGLAPIILESSEQAQYLIPAAVSLAFGEVFATMITLVLVPILASYGTQQILTKQASPSRSAHS
ncbi:efflux RND transporter permease subunit [Halioxenophilus aromaticivorans]|uniref:Efflux RND transporter permease subunit n=1 Tax=Halioxenophilus aromaticivorans TaxID=1306992 RepID=A0AAV3U656_9ALTE